MGTPKYIAQNDPHDALIILNMHKWGKTFFQKKNRPISIGQKQTKSALGVGGPFSETPSHTILGLESPPPPPPRSKFLVTKGARPNGLLHNSS